MYPCILERCGPLQSAIPHQAIYLPIPPPSRVYVFDLVMRRLRALLWLVFSCWSASAGVSLKGLRRKLASWAALSLTTASGAYPTHSRSSASPLARPVVYTASPPALAAVAPLADVGMMGVAVLVPCISRMPGRTQGVSRQGRQAVLASHAALR